MAATLLLLAGAVPFPDSEPGAAIRQRRPGGNPGAQLLQLVVREALERMLDTPHPGPPPNTPAAGADRTFRFPSPAPAALAARLRTAGRRRKQETEERKADGNEAEDEEEEEEEETRHSSDADCVERGGGGRKRGRVLSFSGASAACRRVPHKRTKEAITRPADTVDLVDAGADACHNLPEAADRERARRHRATRQVAVQPGPQTADGHQPVVATSTESTSSSGRVSEQEWRLLGQELRSVARKFAAASGSAPLRRPVYSVRISAGCSGDFNAGDGGEDSGKMMVSTNVVYRAVNFMLWRLLRRLFA
jgi:hypothetical protein